MFYHSHLFSRASRRRLRVGAFYVAPSIKFTRRETTLLYLFVNLGSLLGTVPIVRIRQLYYDNDSKARLSLNCRKLGDQRQFSEFRGTGHSVVVKRASGRIRRPYCQFALYFFLFPVLCS